MVGGLLNLLDAGSILLREVAIDVTQRLKKVMIEIRQLRKGQLTQRDEILYLNTDTITNKRILGKVSCQIFCLTPVTAINRRDGGQHVQFHCFL